MFANASAESSRRHSPRNALQSPFRRHPMSRLRFTFLCLATKTPGQGHPFAAALGEASRDEMRCRVGHRASPIIQAIEHLDGDAIPRVRLFSIVH